MRIEVETTENGFIVTIDPQPHDQRKRYVFESYKELFGFQEEYFGPITKIPKKNANEAALADMQSKGISR